jgi:hypothetical protein
MDIAPANVTWDDRTVDRAILARVRKIVKSRAIALLPVFALAGCVNPPTLTICKNNA